MDVKNTRVIMRPEYKLMFFFKQWTYNGDSLCDHLKREEKKRKNTLFIMNSFKILVSH